MSENAVSLERDEKTVRASVAELIRELAPAQNSDKVGSDARLVEDLNYHSLALMELAFTIEDEFALDPIDEETVLKIVTVADVETHVVNEMRRKGALK
jgi:acyl carrier protein